MSKINPQKGIRDGRLRDLAKAARRQGFELGRTNSDHVYLRCPRCPIRITFSTTVSGRDNRAYLAVLKRLREHGLEYQGIGGVHRVNSSLMN